MWFSFTMKGMRCTYLREARPERAQRRGDGVALAGEGELEEVQRIEVGGVLREAGGRRVLDALVHRQDGEVARAAEAPVVEQRAEVAQHRGLRSLSVKTRFEVVRTGEGEALRGEGLGRVAQEGVRVVAQERVEVGALLMRVSLLEGQVPEGLRGRPGTGRLPDGHVRSSAVSAS